MALTARQVIRTAAPAEAIVGPQVGSTLYGELGKYNGATREPLKLGRYRSRGPMSHLTTLFLTRLWKRGRMP